MQQMGDEARELATGADASRFRSTQGGHGARAGADDEAVDGKARAKAAAAAGLNFFTGRWSA